MVSQEIKTTWLNGTKKSVLMLNWVICSFLTAVKQLPFKDSPKEEKHQAETTTIHNLSKEKEKLTKRKLFQLSKNSKKIVDLFYKSMPINLRKKFTAKLKANLTNLDIKKNDKSVFSLFLSYNSLEKLKLLCKL